MADRLQAVKGMNDVLPSDVAKWHHVEQAARRMFEAFGYREIRTPLVEYTPLFVRGIGEATDIVEKEMYTFTDRDGQKLTMRPEGTASAVRAYVEHSLHALEPVTRLYYSGPMFRHERAQKGRYRQFYQMGCEVFGSVEPTLDAEVIAMLCALFAELGIKGLEVRLGCVGSAEDRPAYRAALVDYFSAHKAALCPDCQRRLETNPLRILDCKVPNDVKVAAGAPSILDHLGDTSRAHFAAVKKALESLAVPYMVDDRMVRGLDYYTGTVFEVRGTGGELGSQNAIAGGGRYDNLVAELGGPPGTPAFGFAFGVERLVMTVPGEAASFEAPVDLFLVTHGAAAQEWAFATAHRLRLRGYRVDFVHKAASFKSQMKRADKLRARYALLVGDEELAKSAVKVRNMQGGDERMVAMSDLDGELERALRAPTS
jgi:histidyl-tRNA synthetase